MGSANAGFCQDGASLESQFVSIEREEKSFDIMKIDNYGHATLLLENFLNKRNLAVFQSA